MPDIEYILTLILSVVALLIGCAVLVSLIRDIVTTKQDDRESEYHDSLPIFKMDPPPLVIVPKHKATDRRCICRLTDVGWMTKDCALHGLGGFDGRA